MDTTETISTICESPTNNFTIAKHKMSKLFGNFNKCSNLCVNKNCADETEDILEYVWHYGYSRYIHHTQFALNKTTIIVNGKSYDVNTPYCCECFKYYVLVGDNTKASHHYGDYCGENNNPQVNVTFNKEPTPSTWTNPMTKKTELLNDWQLKMIGHSV